MKINLLPKDERPLKQSEVRWEFLVGLLGILALGAILLFSHLENAKVAQLTMAYEDALSREVILQRQVQEVQSLKKDLSSLEASVKAQQGLLIEENTSLKMLPVVTKHASSKLWIEGLTWQTKHVELSGYTQDMTSLSQYLNYLNEHSEQAILTAVYPIEDTDFIVFMIEVKGVAHGDSTQLY